MPKAVALPVPNPEMPDETGSPVQLVNVPLAGVPRAGVVKVGPVRVTPAKVETVAPRLMEVEPIVMLL